MELPTVEIVNDKAKSGFTRINEADFDPDVHTLYKAAAEHGGGSNGNSGTNATEGADGQPVAIPADWREMHHTKIIALAKELAGEFEATADKTMTERARSIIEAAEADRANPPAQS